MLLRPVLVRQGGVARHRAVACCRVLTTDHARGSGGAGVVSEMVHRAAESLPHQGILQNFIHHNPLRALQSMTFRAAVKRMHDAADYPSPGAQLFARLGVDPRIRANEAVADLCAVFLDRGAAKWAAPHREAGFLHLFASLELLGAAGWRRHARETARRVLAGEADAETVVRENLAFFGARPAEHQNVVLAMLLELRGWAGMFHAMESHAHERPPGANVRLLDYCAVHSILSRSSIEALARQRGWNATAAASSSSGGSTYAEWLARQRPSYSEVLGQHHLSVQSASALAYADQTKTRRELLERQFERALLEAIESGHVPPLSQRPAGPPARRPELQLYVCIDDRECSLRRHTEKTYPGPVETFGIAGFFGLPVRYRPADGRDEMILAPEGQDPSAVMVEDAEEPQRRRRRRALATMARFWEASSFSPVGSLLLSTLFLPFSVSRHVLMGCAPATLQRMRDGMERTLLPRPQTTVAELPFSADAAAALLARTFKAIGTHRNFAPLVVVLGHGASSSNNPFYAAYNCGACGGRDGGPNARLFARLANDAGVREVLRQAHEVAIPADTVFVGGAHNTTEDTIQFFDQGRLPDTHRAHFARAEQVLASALGENALERCQRFMLAGHVRTAKDALAHVRSRATDPAEVRPELNHASNAAVVVGRRELTRGHFFDRRVFLPSYDPAADDDQGTVLESVLAPALVVCSGINLEYLFSAAEVEHYGAGTKVPLNLVGHIGVLQGTTGDLRPGLPSQMTEMHTPVRALYLIDAPVDRVEAVLRRRQDLRHLVRNDWVRLFVRDPETGCILRQVNGTYVTRGDVHELQPDPLLPPPSDHGVVPFRQHRDHGLGVARREDQIFRLASVAMLGATLGPVLWHGPVAMNPHGILTALGAGLLAYPVLGFSRRYLHGEYMFARFTGLSVALLLGFNLVATAPTLADAMAGWGLFGFASAFLIGAYNERPTARSNATLAFGVYRLSDMAFLTAAAFAGALGSSSSSSSSISSPSLVAGGLLVAALAKSSQFPLTGLFARSMEGPTPTSALGYAGLSAHVGVVLLASTMPLWFPLDWARVAVGSVGLYSAVHGHLVANLRADRKGALAYATSSTVGLILLTLSLGHPDLALLMSFGHTAFRMHQVLRAPSALADSQALRAALGRDPWPVARPEWLYRLGWRLRRLDTDLPLMQLHRLHSVSSRIFGSHEWQLGRAEQWMLTAAGVAVAGAPFTPLTHLFEHEVANLLQTHPAAAAGLMLAHAGVSVLTFHMLMAHVLDARHRFRRPFHPPPTKSEWAGTGMGEDDQDRMGR